MASTYSPSLRLELIGDGDQSGIWGQTTNNNLGGLLEQAVSGVITITMTDANYTMSNYNGVVDEARNQVLIVTGTLTATRNLIAPLVEKTYVVQNSTTGGQSIQLIGSSGLGVTIPNGIAAYVYSDGINFYNAISGSVGNYKVNGNLTVTGTAAITGATTLSSTLAVTGTTTFTGIPSGPTATTGTNTTQLATTAFVQASTTALGLGTMSTQNANAVAITGGTVVGITDLAVADGGTGSSSLTANSVLLGNGTSALSGNLVAPGATGNVLTSNGTTWASTAPVTGFTVVSQGEMLVNSTNTFSVSNSKATLLFIYFGNGFGGNSYLYSNVSWGMGSLTDNRTWYASGVDYQVAQSGSMLVGFAAGSGTTLYARVDANFLGGYGAPSTARYTILQF
jgi:hypothetical protein